MTGQPTKPVVQTAYGALAGAFDPEAGVYSFKGVPFAAPPVGERRWQPPQPPHPWEGTRPATEFGNRPMQLPLFGDMNFRSPEMSEDCLFLNIWTPNVSNEAGLPVLVYFYGGGNMAGDSSEPRYDGATLAAKGLVTLTVNYRLNVFGFLAHPELTQESPHHASGNYGYLDQAAALAWVSQNIAAFGGDPNRVTIAGESAGSSSVSAQMISPLARNLIAGAIGSSGSLIGTLAPLPLTVAEQRGVEFGSKVGATTLAELRVLPAPELLAATTHLWFTGTVDGYFLPRDPAIIFAAGEQAQVPLLVGWNSEEMNYQRLFGAETPTFEGYKSVLKKFFGDSADEALQLYPASTQEELLQSGTDLSGDTFTGYSTWKWSELQAQTGLHPVYRYLYHHPRPPMRPEMGHAIAGLAGGIVREPDATTPPPPPPRGAVHSAEIEYAMGNLETNLVYAWTPEDYAVSELFQEYYANFIKTGNPNGKNLPEWPPLNNDPAVPVMQLDVVSRMTPEQRRERFLFLDKFYK